MESLAPVKPSDDGNLLGDPAKPLEIPDPKKLCEVINVYFCYFFLLIFHLFYFLVYSSFKLFVEIICLEITSNLHKALTLVCS